MISTATSIKATVFDMDGTLVSSLSNILHCENEISLKYNGTRLTLEDVISNFGPPASTIIMKITRNLPTETQTQAVADYYACYRRNAPSRVLVFPGIIELLKKIRSSGKRLALVTGVERVMMEYTLNPFDMSKFFEVCVTADDVQNPKPDPEGVALALKKVGAKANESIYIGDSPADIRAGKQAGVLTGAAMWSPENRGDPSKDDPDYQFRSVQQLTDFLFPITRSGKEQYLGSHLAE